jgi:hypothetical protein
LVSIVARPERFLGRLVKTRGVASACPDLCDATKFVCGTISPSEGPCRGYVALAVAESPQFEARCSPRSSGTQNAVAVFQEDNRFVCRGHCGKWSCPNVTLGQPYDVTARLRSTNGADGQARYVLVPEKPDALKRGTVINANSGE